MEELCGVRDGWQGLYLDRMLALRAQVLQREVEALARGGLVPQHFDPSVPQQGIVIDERLKKRATTHDAPILKGSAGKSPGLDHCSKKPRSIHMRDVKCWMNDQQLTPQLLFEATQTNEQQRVTTPTVVMATPIPAHPISPGTSPFEKVTTPTVVMATPMPEPPGSPDPIPFDESEWDDLCSSLFEETPTPAAVPPAPPATSSDETPDVAKPTSPDLMAEAEAKKVSPDLMAEAEVSPDLQAQAEELLAHVVQTAWDARFGDFVNNGVISPLHMNYSREVRPTKPVVHTFTAPKPKPLPLSPEPPKRAQASTKPFEGLAPWNPCERSTRAVTPAAPDKSTLKFVLGKFLPPDSDVDVQTKLVDKSFEKELDHYTSCSADPTDTSFTGSGTRTCTGTGATQDDNPIRFCTPEPRALLTDDLLDCARGYSPADYDTGTWDETAPCMVLPATCAPPKPFRLSQC